MEAATVGEALEQLTRQYPDLRRQLYNDEGKLRPFVKVYVNGDDIRTRQGLATALGSGDVLSIVPSIAGGSDRGDAAMGREALQQTITTPMTFRLDLNWNVKDVAEPADLLPPEARRELETLLAELAVYYPGVQLNAVVIEPASADLVQVDSAGGRLRLGPAAFQSAELLRFAVSIGLADLLFHQGLTHLATDPETERRVQHRKAKLNKLLQLNAPTRICLNEAVLLHELIPAVDSSLQSLLKVLRWADVVGWSTRTPEARQRVLSQLPDRELAALLEAMQGKPWEERTLLAAGHLEAKGTRFSSLIHNLPGASAEIAKALERTRCLDAAAYREGVKQMSSTDLLTMISETLRQASPHASADQLALLRTMDLLLQVDINHRKVPPLAFETVDRLAGLVGAETLARLRAWHGPAMTRFLDHVNGQPAFLEWVRWLGPERSRAVLTGSFHEVLAYVGDRDFPTTEEAFPSALESLEALVGRQTLEAQTAGELLRAIAIFARAPAAMARLRVAVEQMRTEAGDEALQAMWRGRLAHSLERLREMTWDAVLRSGWMAAGDAFPEEIERIIGAHPEEPLTLSWLLGSDVRERREELSRRLGREAVDRALARDPIGAFYDMAFFSSSTLSLRDLDTLLSVYQPDELSPVFQKAPGEFAAFLLLLRHVDPDFVERLGPGVYREAIRARGVASFLSGWSRSLSEGPRTSLDETYLDASYRPDTYFRSLEDFLADGCPWMPEDVLRRLFVDDPALLRSILWASGQVDPEDEDEMPAEPWPGLARLFELIGSNAVSEWLREDPGSFLLFLRTARSEGLWEHNPQACAWPAIGSLKRALGGAGLARLLKAEPRFVVRQLLPGKRLMVRQQQLRDVARLGRVVWGPDGLRAHPAWIANMHGALEQPASRQERLLGAIFGSRRTTKINQLLALSTEGEGLKIGAADAASVAAAIRSGLQQDPVVVVMLLGLLETERGLQLLCDRMGTPAVLQALAHTPERLFRALCYLERDHDERFLRSFPEFEERRRWLKPEDLDQLDALAGWDAEERRRCFLEDPAGFMETAHRWRRLSDDRRRAVAQVLKAWGSAGVTMLTLARRSPTTLSLLLDALEHAAPELDLATALNEQLLPQARQRASHPEREGPRIVWRARNRLLEARYVLELSQAGLGISEVEALRLWQWLLDRAVLPIDQMADPEILSLVEQDSLAGPTVVRILGQASPDAEAFRIAAGLAVQIPAWFRQAAAQAPGDRRQALEQAAVRAAVERTLEALRYSTVNQLVLNRLIIRLADELLAAREGRVAPAQMPVSRLLNFLPVSAEPAQLSTWVQTMRQTSLAAIAGRLRLLGVQAADEVELSRRVEPELFVRFGLYVLDELFAPAATIAALGRIVGQDAAIQRYLIGTVRAGLEADRRFEPRYRQAIRLLALDPKVCRDAVAQLPAGLDPSARRVLEADLVNAVVENRFNQVVASHADLVLAQPEGVGLVPLRSKLEALEPKGPLTLEALQGLLADRGVLLELQEIEASLDPFLCRAWQGVVTPRLSVLTRGYRGSRAFDDAEARYITRAATVAVRYAWRGGEAARGAGERVVHEWSFPVIAERIAELPAQDGASTRITGPAGDAYLLQVSGGRLQVAYARFEERLARLMDSSAETGAPDEPGRERISVEVPGPDELRLLSIPGAGPKGQTQHFQVGRAGDRLFVMRVDPHVALANHFDQAPGAAAYVRQVSTEGQPDLQTVRQLIQMQVGERLLVEELLDAVDRLEQTEETAEAAWALRTMFAVLQDLDPATPSPAAGRMAPGLQQPYFDHVFGPLRQTVFGILRDGMTRRGTVRRRELTRIKQDVAGSPTVQRLRHEQERLAGTFEAYVRDFAVDPYHTPGGQRRTMGNRFIQMLRLHPQPSREIRRLYERGDLAYFLQEFTLLSGVTQSPRFHRGVAADEHTLRVAEAMDQVIASGLHPIRHPEELRLLALFHDVGKAEGGRGHAGRSANALDRFLMRVNAPPPVIRRLTRVVEIHQSLGNLAASEVRRIAGGRQAELESEAFRTGQFGRVLELAMRLRRGATEQDALAALDDLYVLTIADSMAIPFPEGDTGTRYTTLFAERLADVKERVVRAIRDLGASSVEPAEEPPAEGSEFHDLTDMFRLARWPLAASVLVAIGSFYAGLGYAGLPLALLAALAVLGWQQGWLRRRMLTTGLALLISGGLALVAVADRKLNYFRISDSTRQVVEFYTLANYGMVLEGVPASAPVGGKPHVSRWKAEIQENLDRIQQSVLTTPALLQHARRAEKLIDQLGSVGATYEHFEFLWPFVQRPQIVTVPLSSARAIVARSKVAILETYLGALKSDAAQGMTPQERVEITRRIASLLDYEERVDASDPAFPKFFPFSEATWLTARLRVKAADVLIDLAASGPPQLREIARAELARRGLGPETAAYHQLRATVDVYRMWLMSQGGLEENQLILSQRLEGALEDPIHRVPLLLAPAAQELHRLPPAVVTQLRESANAHRIPADALAAHLIHFEDLAYPLEQQLKLFTKRRTSGALSLLARALIVMVEDSPIGRMTLPHRWQDGLGAFVGGNPSMGLFQIRPSLVRQHQAWRRFGIDVSTWSDQAIALKLLDTRYNIEAWAAILAGLANETEALRRQAVDAVQDHDLVQRHAKLDVVRSRIRAWQRAGSREETIGMLTFGGLQITPELYAQVPSRDALGDEWAILALFHPRDFAKAAMAWDIGNRSAIMLSGIFDQKRSLFVEVPVELIDRLENWVRGSDQYLKQTALVTLVALSQDPTEPEAQRRAQAVLDRLVGKQKPAGAPGGQPLYSLGAVAGGAAVLLAAWPLWGAVVAAVALGVVAWRRGWLRRQETRRTGGLIVSVVLGGSNIRGGLVDEQGTLIEDSLVISTTPAKALGTPALIVALSGAINTVLDRAESSGQDLSRLSAVKIGSPGVIHEETGAEDDGWVVRAYNVALDNRNVRQPLEAAVAQRLGRPLPVRVHNDVEVEAEAERPDEATPYVYLNLGTGLNAAAGLGTEVMSLEFGGTPVGDQTLEELYKQAKRDPRPAEAIAAVLTQPLAQLLRAVGAKTLVIGGGAAENVPGLLGALQRVLTEQGVEIAISPARFSEESRGVIGAARRAATRPAAGTELAAVRRLVERLDETVWQAERWSVFSVQAFSVEWERWSVELTDRLGALIDQREALSARERVVLGLLIWRSARTMDRLLALLHQHQLINEELSRRRDMAQRLVTRLATAASESAPAAWSRGGAVPPQLATHDQPGIFRQEAPASTLTPAAVVTDVRKEAAGKPLNQVFSVPLGGEGVSFVKLQVPGTERQVILEQPLAELLTRLSDQARGALLKRALDALAAEGPDLAYDPAKPLVFLTSFFLSRDPQTGELLRHAAGNCLGDGLIVLDPSFKDLPEPLQVVLLVHELRHEATGESGDAVEQRYAELDARLLVHETRRSGLTIEQIAAALAPFMAPSVLTPVLVRRRALERIAGLLQRELKKLHQAGMSAAEWDGLLDDPGAMLPQLLRSRSVNLSKQQQTDLIRNMQSAVRTSEREARQADERQSRRGQSRVIQVMTTHATADDFTRHETVLKQAMDDARAVHQEFVLALDYGGPPWVPEEWGGRSMDQVDDRRRRAYFEKEVRDFVEHLAGVRTGTEPPVTSDDFLGALSRWVGKTRARVQVEHAQYEDWLEHSQDLAEFARFNRHVRSTGLATADDRSQAVSILRGIMPRMVARNQRREARLRGEISKLCDAGTHVCALYGAGHEEFLRPLEASGVRFSVAETSRASATFLGWGRWLVMVARGEPVSAEQELALTLEYVLAFRLVLFQLNRPKTNRPDYTNAVQRMA